MDLAIKDILETYGTSAIAHAMGLPVSTVHSWKRAGKLPGEGGKASKQPLYEMRAQALRTAVRLLKKASRKRGAA